MLWATKLPSKLHLIRQMHVTRAAQLKQIVATESSKTTVIEGKHVSSSRQPYLIDATGNANACPVCRLGLDIKHTDVLILHQFTRSDGCMLPRRITGLCNKQQKRIGNMVSMAQKAGILTPPGSKSDPSKRKDYKRWNTYFDESTIKA